MRERGGRTLPFVFRAEDEAVPTIRERVATRMVVYADKAPGWDALHARFDTRRINHSIAFSDDGACTNQAESYFARLRRAEWGEHHHISGRYLGAYVDDDGGRRLVGHADVPEDAGPVYEVPMFGAAAPSIVESFAIGTVTHLPDRGGAPVVERAVRAAPGQLVHLLPGWVPLAS